MGALSLLTVGAYVPIWFGLTWAELRRETGNAAMLPLGHALSTLIPGWNAWQAWRHFRAIDVLLESAGRPERIDATSGALGLVIWWLTFTHYSAEPMFLLLDAIELLSGTAVLVYGQRALNAYWAAKDLEEHVLASDRILLALAVAYAILTVAGFLSATP